MTIGFVIIPLLFRRDVSFKLLECDLTDEMDKVRTKFSTQGTTRWGSKVKISGEDFFWFGNSSNKIVRHESIWDQTAEEVYRSIGW